MGIVGVSCPAPVSPVPGNTTEDTVEKPMRFKHQNPQKDDMNQQTVTRAVRLTGTAPIHFDRTMDWSPNNGRDPIKKMWIDEKRRVCIHEYGIICRLSSTACPKVWLTRPKGLWLHHAVVALVGCRSESSVRTKDGDYLVPLTRHGEPIIVGKFTRGYDSKSRIRVHECMIMVGGGHPIAFRPVLDTPWELEFNVTLLENGVLSEDRLRSLFEMCGTTCGLGANHTKFGKFRVSKWQ